MAGLNDYQPSLRTIHPKDLLSVLNPWVKCNIDHSNQRQTVNIPAQIIAATEVLWHNLLNEWHPWFYEDRWMITETSVELWVGDRFLWAPLGCSLYLTACCYWRQHPWAPELDTVVFSVMGFFSTISAPRHATSSIGMIRLLLNSWLPAPRMALLMQFALEPGFLADACQRESVSNGQEFAELVLSETVLLLGLVLAHYKQQASLFTQISASMSAESR
eukprot:Skav212008  [mRNA]  locus=scaffold304:349266:357816:+ [translate_table: standard]